MKSRLLRTIEFLLPLIFSGCSVFSADSGYQEPAANKGEVKFINGCMHDKVDCRWLRWTQIDAYTYQMVDTYAFRGGLATAGLIDSRRCDDLQEAGARTWGGGETHSYGYRPIGNGRCILEVPSRNVSTTWFERIFSGKPHYHFVRLHQTYSTRPDGVKLGVTYKFGGDTKTRAVFQSGANLMLFGESTPLDGGVIKASVRNGEGYIIDFTTRAEDVPVEIGMSAYASWKDYGADYLKVWAANVMSPLARKADVASSLEAALKDYHALGLTYRVTVATVGVLPRSGPDAVVKRGFGDCKDLAVVMAASLAKHGLASEPVVTRLAGSQTQLPSLVRIPQLAWPNHIILYVPDAKVYLDPTLLNGDLVVNALYPGYMRPGVNLATGRLLLLGENP